MEFNFPEINPGFSKGLDHYSERVKLEVDEFQKAESLDDMAMEAIDVLHAAETLVRKFFLEHPELNITAYIHDVKVKNSQRGYYTSKGA